MAQVVIFGTGQFAQVAHVYLRDDSAHEVVAFTVHERYLESPTAGESPSMSGLPVVPWERLAESHPPGETSMFVAMGFSKVNKLRAAIYSECKAAGYELISYVSSRATMVGEAELGDNCFVFEENVIQPFVRIGNDVILWSGNHIGHHSTIADHCFIASHAVISGSVTIGESCFIGVNATLRDGVTIAPECVIGASALILRDTEHGEVYAGTASEPRTRKSWELTNF